jgi:hypothetical protein
MNFGVYLRRRDERGLCGLGAGGCWSFGRDISIEWLESLSLIPVGAQAIIVVLIVDTRHIC